MNYIEQIAEILGVEMDEPFHLHDKPSYIRYCFTSKGLEFLDDSQPVVELHPVLTGTLINAILTGESKIVKIPFKPYHKEKYWTYRCKTWEVEETLWQMLPVDYARFQAGMVFRSENQAIKNRPAIYEKLTGKKWRD